MRTSTRGISRFASVAFSTAGYRRLLAGGDTSQLDDAIGNLRSLLSLGERDTNGTVVDATWRWLLEHRRDDAALRSLFLSRSSHNPFGVRGFDFAFELRLGAATADFACLSLGHEEVVEIKSIVDSASRIDSQVTAYRRVFPRLSLVGDAHDGPRIATLARRHNTGLLLLERHRSGARLIRDLDAPVIDDGLSVAALIKLLQLRELGNVVADLTGERLDAPRTAMYSTAREALIEASVEPSRVLHAVMSQVSARRRLSASVVERDVHPALRSVVATIDPPRDQLSVLRDWLNAEA